MRVSAVTVRRRLIFILITGMLIFGIFTARLAYVQFYMNGWLTRQALDSWSRQIPYEAERGDILDRNGEVLATIEPAFRIGCAETSPGSCENRGKIGPRSQC